MYPGRPRLLQYEPLPFTLNEQLEKQEIDQKTFDESLKKLKPGKLFNHLNSESNASDAWSILDKVLRTRVDHQGETPFKGLPAKASEQVRKQISSEFSGWINSLKSFKANGSGHTGQPRMPGYLGKNDLNVVKYFAGSLGQQSLPTIANRESFLDYAKTQALPPEALQAYQDFDLKEAQSLLRRHLVGSNVFLL